jgi:hypothetical protein
MLAIDATDLADLVVQAHERPTTSSITKLRFPSWWLIIKASSIITTERSKLALENLIALQN